MQLFEDRMRIFKQAGALLLTVAMSTFLVACGGDEDGRDRAALERESLERELELALQPDTTVETTLTDLPIVAEEEPAPPPLATRTPAPQPAPRPAPPVRRETPQQTTPAPRPAPAAPAPAPAPAAPRMATFPVPAGSTFAVRLDQELSTRNNPTGSTFTATLTEAIRAADGTVLFPAGSTVRGRVVESRESQRAGQDAHISIEFTAIVDGGRSYPISGAALNTPMRLVTRDSRTEQAAKIGAGAAAGAVLGQVIGRNTRSTVAGAAIGAAAGTAVAVGTADVDAVVDSGSHVNVRLGSTIQVEKRM
jgi:hypothetical protein